MSAERTGEPALAMRFKGSRTQRLAGVEVPVAESFRARLLGLAHLERRFAGAGLLIPRCRSVHTFGMRFPIDIYFLGDDDHLLKRLDAVPPGRLARCRGAKEVLELVSDGGEKNSPGT